MRIKDGEMLSAVSGKRQLKTCSRRSRPGTASSVNIACFLMHFASSSLKRREARLFLYFMISCLSIYLFLPTWGHHVPLPEFEGAKGGQNDSGQNDWPQAKLPFEKSKHIIVVAEAVEFSRFMLVEGFVS